MVWISNVLQRPYDKGLLAGLWRVQQVLGGACAAEETVQWPWGDTLYSGPCLQLPPPSIMLPLVLSPFCLLPLILFHTFLLPRFSSFLPILSWPTRKLINWDLLNHAFFVIMFYLITGPETTKPSDHGRNPLKTSAKINHSSFNADFVTYFFHSHRKLSLS